MLRAKAVSVNVPGQIADKDVRLMAQVIERGDPRQDGRCEGNRWHGACSSDAGAGAIDSIPTDRSKEVVVRISVFLGTKGGTSTSHPAVAPLSMQVFMVLNERTWAKHRKADYL